MRAQQLKAVCIVSLLLGISACNKSPQSNEANSEKSSITTTESMPHEEGVVDTVHDHAHDDMAALFSILSPQVSVPIPGQKVTSAYFALTNNNDKAVTLQSITSDASEITEFHTMSMDGNKMVMRKLDSLTIPAGATHVFHEGSNHIMLINLKKALKEGDMVSFEILLKNGQRFEMSAPVKAASEHDHHDHAHHDHTQHDHTQHEQGHMENAQAHATHDHDEHATAHNHTH